MRLLCRVNPFDSIQLFLSGGVSVLSERWIQAIFNPPIISITTIIMIFTMYVKVLELET